MKILALNGSVRKDGCTSRIINQLFCDLNSLAGNINSEVIHIADKKIESCKVSCSQHCIDDAFRCSIKDDAADIFHKMVEADALIIGAPLYFRVPPAKFHMFVERMISMFYYQESQGIMAMDSPLQGKPCALIGVAEYSNPTQVLEYLVDFCSILKMKTLVLTRFPYLGIGGQGELAGDKIFMPLERSKEMAGLLVQCK